MSQNQASRKWEEGTLGGEHGRYNDLEREKCLACSRTHKGGRGVSWRELQELLEAQWNAEACNRLRNRHLREQIRFFKSFPCYHVGETEDQGKAMRKTLKESSRDVIRTSTKKKEHTWPSRRPFGVRYYYRLHFTDEDVSTERQSHLLRVTQWGVSGQSWLNYHSSSCREHIWAQLEA